MALLAIGTLTGYFAVSQVEHEASPREDRFQGLRRLLPPRATVGYLGDKGSVLQNPRPYYLAQYSLAPVVLAPDSDHELVVADCSSPQSMSDLAASKGLKIERDLGNGVALLRRVTR
jgi:hypothetical protein